MKRFLLFSLTIIMVSSLVFAGCAQPAPAPAPVPAPKPAPAPKPTPIVLKAVTFLAVAAVACRPLKMFIDKVNEKSKGELVIQLVGGPEVVPGSEQPMAVKRGVVDMSFQ